MDSEKWLEILQGSMPIYIAEDDPAPDPAWMLII